MPDDPRAAERPTAAGPGPVTIAMLFVLGVSFALAILAQPLRDGRRRALRALCVLAIAGRRCRTHAHGRRPSPPAADRLSPSAHLPLGRGAEPLLPLHAARLPCAQSAGEPVDLGPVSGAGDDLRAGAGAQAGPLPPLPLWRNPAGARRHPRGAGAAGEPAGAGHGRLGGAGPAALALLCGSTRCWSRAGARSRRAPCRSRRG